MQSSPCLLKDIWGDAFCHPKKSKSQFFSKLPFFPLEDLLKSHTQLFLALGEYPKVLGFVFSLMRKAFSFSEPGSLEPSDVDLANALRRLQSLGPGKQAPSELGSRNGFWSFILMPQTKAAIHIYIYIICSSWSGMKCRVMI